MPIPNAKENRRDIQALIVAESRRVEKKKRVCRYLRLIGFDCGNDDDDKDLQKYSFDYSGAKTLTTNSINLRPQLLLFSSLIDEPRENDRFFAKTNGRFTAWKKRVK